MYRYRCWNDRCHHSGFSLVSRDVFWFDGQTRCRECGRSVAVSLPDWLVIGLVTFGLLLVAFLVFGQ
jgi:hypothetical protein